MIPRLNIFHTAPEGVKAMLAVDANIEKSGIEQGLLDLVRLRASQINGCAFCIDLHVKQAIKNGEKNIRIHLLDGWRDSPLFTDRERAALNWTESLTRIVNTHAPDTDFALIRSQFSDSEIAHLTLLIGTINLWNRVQIGLRAVHPIEPPTATR